MARVLVTGGTGFIGRRLVAHLVERGDTVRCLIHRSEKPPADVECVPGDITVPETLEPAVREADRVYHLAGATMVVSPRRYQPINSLGTRNVGEACARLTSPPTLVYLSSLAAAGPTTPDRPRREEDVPAPVSAYGRSKLAGERYLRQLADRLSVTVLRPPGVFGPGDPNLLRLFKTTQWKINIVPGDRGQRLSFIYVDDIVLALTQAALQGERLANDEARPDQGVYFVALDEHPTMAELGHLAGIALGGIPARPLVVPAWLSQLTGHVNDFLARLTMQPKLITSDKMREALAGSWLCSSDKAKRHWGFTCRIGLADGFQKTVQWYRDQRWL